LTPTTEGDVLFFGHSGIAVYHVPLDLDGQSEPPSTTLAKLDQYSVPGKSSRFRPLCSLILGVDHFAPMRLEPWQACLSSSAPIKRE